MSLPGALWWSLGSLAFAGLLGPADFSGDFDANPVLTWRVELPGPPVAASTHSEMGGALITGDHIFVGSAGSDALYMLDRRDGRVVQVLEADGPVQSAPVVQGDRLYFADAAGTTWCYPLSGGKALWSHRSGAPILAPPTLDGDRLYVATVDNVVRAMNLDSGELLWRYTHRTDPTRTAVLELYGAPSPIRVGAEVVVGFPDGRIVGIDITSGEERWQRGVGEGSYPDVMAAPLSQGNELVVAGFTEPLVALDAATRNVRWRLDVGGAFPPIADPTGAIVFHGGTDGHLRALDLRSGELLWDWDSHTGASLTAPVFTPAGLLVSASAGSTYLLDATSGSVTWSWYPTFHPAGFSSTAAVDGRQAVVVTNAGFVMSFVVPRPAATWSGWWPGWRR